MSTHGPDGTAIPSITTALPFLPLHCVRAPHPKLTSPPAVLSPSQVAFHTEDGQEGFGIRPERSPE